MNLSTWAEVLLRGKLEVVLLQESTDNKSITGLTSPTGVTRLKPSPTSSTLKVKRRQRDFSTQKQWWCSGCHDWVPATLPAASPSLRAQCYWVPPVYMEDQEDSPLLMATETLAHRYGWNPSLPHAMLCPRSQEHSSEKTQGIPGLRRTRMRPRSKIYKVGDSEEMNKHERGRGGGGGMLDVQSGQGRYPVVSLNTEQAHREGVRAMMEAGEGSREDMIFE